MLYGQRKRHKQLEQSLEKAREVKRIQTVGEGMSGTEPQESDLSGLLSMSDDSLDTVQP